MKFIKIIKSTNDIERALNDDYWAKRFLSDGTINKYDAHYVDVLRKAIEYDSKFAYHLLYSRKIKESSPLYNEVLEKAISDTYVACALLTHEVITKYSPYYTKVLKEIINDDKYGDRCINILLKDQIITEEELEKFKHS